MADPDPARASKTIDLIYFNAGGGHRAAAMALEAVIREQGRPWQVRCVNLFEMLDPAERFRRITGVAPEDLYNLRLATGWTVGLAQELKLLQGLIRIGHGAIVRRLSRHWLRTKPDMVVSLVPNFNRAVFDGITNARPGVPCVTVLTDMADNPPNFWIERDQTHHVVCGSDKAVAQARAMGCAEAVIHRTSGMIIRPDFYRALPMDRDAERLRLGLDAGRPTGVVMFGGQGSMAMLHIAKELDDTQLILLCGHHQSLAVRLRALKSSAARAVIGFTPDVQRYLRLGDFFIGKPGPGCLSEAVQQGLPVITSRNAWTLPQERDNTDWIRQNGLGVVSGSIRKVRPAVDELLGRLDEVVANVRRINNLAVFEVPDILAAILETGAPRIGQDVCRPCSAPVTVTRDTPVGAIGAL